ncbi:MAG: CotH kinase family protein [Candidatus Marinimicrobia bacterium]|nr:CotH kinase family protein [Candidatus Neomarinimicrobiota bacterium]
MINRILIIFLIFFANLMATAFESSNLPIILINTNGREIPDEEKISAEMKIIWNEDGSRNFIAATTHHYIGKIGIEIRGSSSVYFFPKKQYALETRDEQENNLNVSLLGLPKENDWILHAPYSDKTFMRNVLTYTITRKMGWYASRCKFCELILNNQYMGIYILMEKIKRDDNRVDINKLNSDEISGDDLTGGYIIKIDKFSGENVEGWQSKFTAAPFNNKPVYYQFHDPKYNELADEQINYIKGKIDYFETIMSINNYNEHFDKLINSDSFVDYFLINEWTKNVDGYRLSTFLYKDKDSNDPRFYAGPIWDYNLAFGNANYYEGEKIQDWMLDIYLNNYAFQDDSFHPPFWWHKLWYDENLHNQAVNRWFDLRRTIFSETSIFSMIDSMATLLDESQQRNYERWPNVLGEWIWPNPEGYQNRKTFLSEVNYLKSWINGRLNWIDANIDFYNVAIDNEEKFIEKYYLIENYPNPFNAQTVIKVQIPVNQHVNLKILNIKGNIICTVFKGNLMKGIHYFRFDGSDLASGLYFYQLQTTAKCLSGKAVLMK